MDQRENLSASDLTSFTAEQLRQLLSTQLDAEKPDLDLIRKAAAILEQREPLPFDPDTAYRSLLQDHLPAGQLCGPAQNSDPVPMPRRPRFARFARVAAAIAVAILVLLGGTVVSYALGFDLWGTVIRWSADTFGFSSEHSTDQRPMIETEDPYSGLREAVRNAGGSFPVVPHYLPDGYQSIETTREETFEGVSINGIYKNESDAMLFSFVVSQSDHPVRYYPIDSLEPEIFETGGVTHYVMANENEYAAVWENGNVLCNISGVPEKAELLKMLESIYEEDSQP